MRPGYLHSSAAVNMQADRKTSARTFPVHVVTVPKIAMRVALRLAGGDRTRLRPQPDGSVIVVNPPDGRRCLTTGSL